MLIPHCREGRANRKRAFALQTRSRMSACKSLVTREQVTFSPAAFRSGIQREDKGDFKPALHSQGPHEPLVSPLRSQNRSVNPQVSYSISHSSHCETKTYLQGSRLGPGPKCLLLPYCPGSRHVHRHVRCRGEARDRKISRLGLQPAQQDSNTKVYSGNSLH